MPRLGAPLRGRRSPLTVGAGSRGLRAAPDGRHALVVRLCAAAVGGVALWASLPPRGWWWLVPLAIAALIGAVDGEPLGRRVLLGWVFGLGWAIPSLSWAAAFTGWGYGLLVAVQAAFPALAAGLSHRRHVVIALPGALVLAEFLRWRWPLGGLPLGSPALALVDGPWLEVASYGGPLLLLLCAGIAATAVVATVRQRWVTAAAAAAVTATAGLVPAVLPAAVGTIDVAVVQGGGERGVPAVRSDADAVFDRHLAASAAVPEGTDLVVWPEDVVDVPRPFDVGPERARLAALAAASDATYLVGVVEDGPAGRFRNSAVVLAGSGAVVDRYEKIHRVPFGEYVPFRPFLERFVDLSLVPRDAIAGTGPPAVTAAGATVGVTISYEGSFARYARAATRAGAELLAIPTNAASYVTDEVPAQQLAGARLRGVESGRTVLQAAPTGYSAIVTADGVVTQRSSLGRSAVLTGRITMRRGWTPYVRYGDLPVVGLAAGLLLAGLVARRGRARPDAARTGRRGRASWCAAIVLALSVLPALTQPTEATAAPTSAGVAQRPPTEAETSGEPTQEVYNTAGFVLFLIVMASVPLIGYAIYRLERSAQRRRGDPPA